MKNFVQWANALSCRKMLFWVTLLVLSGCLSFWSPPLGFLSFLAIVSAMLICCDVKNRNLTFFLIGCLAFSFAPQQRARAAIRQDCNAIILAGAVIIVGGIIVYKMVRFCQKHLGPTPPSSPPPTPGTNSPPSTNKTSNFSMLARVNMPPAMLYDDSNPLPTVDISQMGWTDYTQAGNPVPFQDYAQIPILSSTDMQNWTNAYYLSMWFSSNSVESVLYDANMTPLLTNWCPGNPYAAAFTNNLPWPIVNQSERQRFFR